MIYLVVCLLKRLLHIDQLFQVFLSHAVSYLLELVQLLSRLVELTPERNRLIFLLLLTFLVALLQLKDKAVLGVRVGKKLLVEVLEMRVDNSINELLVLYGIKRKDFLPSLACCSASYLRTPSPLAAL